MIGLFREPKKVDRLSAFGLELDPTPLRSYRRETDGRQDLLVKALGGFAVLHPEINVIEKARAHDLSMALSEQCVMPDVLNRRQ